MNAQEPKVNKWHARLQEAAAQKESPSEQKQSNAQPTAQNGAPGSFIEQEFRRLLGVSAEELQRKSMSFIENYKRLTNDGQRGAAVATYFLEVNGWRA